jgi:arabinan endo-1,5-alpha-L-arabinosidase
MDVAPRCSVMDAVPGGGPGSEVIARGGNNTWAPESFTSAISTFSITRTGHAAEGRHRHLVGRALDPASPDYKWEDGGASVWSDGAEEFYGPTSSDHLRGVNR